MKLYIEELNSERQEISSYKELTMRQNLILENLRLLGAKFVDDSKLIRVGPNAEGGYVIYNDIAKLDSVISVGVAKDTAFEEHLSELSSGLPNIHLFDHTDMPLRKLPRNLHFHSQGIGPVSDAGKSLITLAEMIDLYIDSEEQNILKIDVDGAEYLSLSVCNSNHYKNFNQIIIEFHNIADSAILGLEFNKILKEILNDFFVIHLHPNNFEPWKVVCGFALPNVLEVTFLHKKYENQIENKIKLFPTKLDYPNDTKNEMFLGSFLF